MPDRLESQPPIDVALVIALGEEFREFVGQETATVPLWDAEIQSYIYRFERAGYRCAAILIGAIGPVQAALAAERLRTRGPLQMLNVGIAGGFDVDVRLGDVVIGTVVDAYLEASKAVDTPDGLGFVLQLSGETYRPRGELTTHARNLEFVQRERFACFVAAGRERYMALVPEGAQESLEAKGLVRPEPQVVPGKVASGPTVVGATAFTRWLKARDRKYLVVEMESAGFLAACEPFDVQTLVVRGVSDFADHRKIALDRLGDGAIRKLAMSNALRFVWAMMDAGVFGRHPIRSLPAGRD